MTISTKRTNHYVKVLAALAATFVVEVGLVLASATTPAHASTTYTVNVVGDQADLKLNDNPNVCDVNPLFAGPQCTLRAAIQEANQTIGSDTITFQMPDNPNIPGAEVKPIEIASALPKITERVTIDGYPRMGPPPTPWRRAPTPRSS
jgi:CSLREA domain-containing protein